VKRFLRFFRKRQDGFAPTFFQGLGENTCLLQLALNNTAPGLKRSSREHSARWWNDRRSR